MNGPIPAMDSMPNCRSLVPVMVGIRRFTLAAYQLQTVARGPETILNPSITNDAERSSVDATKLSVSTRERATTRSRPSAK